MMCDNCKKNEANIHVSKVINGMKYEQNLCMECASAQPEVAQMFSSMGGFFQMPQMMQMAGLPLQSGAIHQKRGMDVEDFESLGLKLPGHAGVGAQQTQSVEREETLEELKHQLADAVQGESFERAAELRDKIFLMEKKMRGE